MVDLTITQMAPLSACIFPVASSGSAFLFIYFSSFLNNDHEVFHSFPSPADGQCCTLLSQPPQCEHIATHGKENGAQASGLGDIDVDDG